MAQAALKIKRIPAAPQEFFVSGFGYFTRWNG
jgi:hypothetical protein